MASISIQLTALQAQRSRVVVLKRIAIHAAWIVATYFVGWTIGYAMAAGGNFSLYWQWLEMVWTNEAFERPLGAQFFAILFTLFWWIVFAMIRIWGGKRGSA